MDATAVTEIEREIKQSSFDRRMGPSTPQNKGPVGRSFGTPFRSRRGYPSISPPAIAGHGPLLICPPLMRLFYDAGA